jgi:hypothetical protein
VVVLNKNGKLKICVDFKKLNKVTKKNPYPLPFFNEVLNIVTRYETYSFLDGYLGYHQIFITHDDRYKITFVIDWGAFVWMVIPFGVKNGPPTFQREVSIAFRDYLNQFMKIFLDDFTVYSDIESHLMKLKLCFQKCRESRFSLNPEKCAFMVFSGLILGFIISKRFPMM